MALSARREVLRKLALFGGFAALAARPGQAQAPSQRFVKREAAERSGYSQGCRPRRAHGLDRGHTGAVDATAKSLAAIRRQVRADFAAIERTLAEADAKLSIWSP